MVIMADKVLTDNCELGKVAEWLKEVKFKKTLIGGVDERDVWKKLDELNALYNSVLVAERARYDALLAASMKTPESDTKGDTDG